MAEEEKDSQEVSVANFQAMTETSDPAVAIQYLTANAWDVSVRTNAFTR